MQQFHVGVHHGCPNLLDAAWVGDTSAGRQRDWKESERGGERLPGKIAAAVAFDSCVRLASALIAFPLCANLPSRRPLWTCCASSYCMTSRLASFCCTNPAVFCCPNFFESCSPLPCRRPLRIHCATFCCTTPHSVTAPCSAVPSLMHPVPLSLPFRPPSRTRCAFFCCTKPGLASYCSCCRPPGGSSAGSTTELQGMQTRPRARKTSPHSSRCVTGSHD